jgi:regulator of sigma E protease
MSSSFLWAVGAFFLVLTPIILVHELGHFGAARLSKIRVDEFGLGFPPRAVKLFERNGTIYSLNWIPLGGFVRPAGEDDPSVPDGLAAASIRARLFTLSAGAGANFILALFIFWIAYMIGPPSYQVSIPQVMPDSPAEAAGLRPGDVILQVNGIPVNGSEVVIEEVSGSAGVPVEFVVLRNQAHFWIGLGIGGVGVPGEFVVLRDQQKISIVVTPRVPGEYNPETDGPTGIQLSSIPTGENVSYGPVRSLVMSGEMIFEIIYRTLQAPVMLIQGQISPAEARPVSVVGISQLGASRRRDGHPG